MTYSRCSISCLLREFVLFESQPITSVYRPPRDFFARLTSTRSNAASRPDAAVEVDAYLLCLGHVGLVVRVLYNTLLSHNFLSKMLQTDVLMLLIWSDFTVTLDSADAVSDPGDHAADAG